VSVRQRPIGWRHIRGPADWEPVLADLVRTPPGWRQPIAPQEVANILNCTPPVLAALVEAYGAGDGIDAVDVWNIGLLSGSGWSRSELEMRYLRRRLNATDWFEPVTHEVLFEVRCPRGEQCAGAEWSTPAVRDARWTASSVRAGGGWWRGTVPARGERVTVRSAEILDGWHAMLAGYRFHYNHQPLDEPGAVRRRGVGSCLGLSALLAEELTAGGCDARVQRGFVLGDLAAQVHQWTEVRDGDSWVRLDPSLAALSDAFFTPEYREYCLGSRFNHTLAFEAGATAEIIHPCGPEVLEVQPMISRPRPPRRPS
jgi:hypothetical protein